MADPAQVDLADGLAADVVVIGSGAGALVAALRAADLGLTVIVAEKMHRYGGTSALSGGGLWIPAHGLPGDSDTRENALTYLTALCGREASPARLRAYVDHAAAMLARLIEAGLSFEVFPGYPDYFPNLPGATTNRAVFPAEIDGRLLGQDLFTLRDQPFVFKLFNRYTLDLSEAFALSLRARGWQWIIARIMLRYWSDLAMRRRTRRDRRLTMGNALIGGLRKALQARSVPLFLNTRLIKIESDGERANRVVLSRNDVRYTVTARCGVILGAGGFEQSQELRDRHFPTRTQTRWSLTPPGANEGDAIAACEGIGADTQFMQYGWWAPTMQLPSISTPNVDSTHQMFLDHRHPHSVCVNRLGRRFVNESCSYDLFGIAMIEDQRRTGANIPCWMVFDASYRAKYGCGGIMPAAAMPDRRLPPEWFDQYLYRADSIPALARKIDVDPEALTATVAQMNEAARTGIDPEFRRGEAAYDRYFGDPRMTPNPCMGPIDKPPFYAIRIDLGDIGTKGGLRANEHAQVLDRNGQPIEGLYAVGNCAASPFVNAYPGAGGTLGPAAVFGHIAAEHIAAARR